MPSVILIVDHPFENAGRLVEELAKHSITATVVSEKEAPKETILLNHGRSQGSRVVHMGVIGHQNHSGLRGLALRILSGGGNILSLSSEEIPKLPPMEELLKVFDSDSPPPLKEVPFWKEIGVNSKKSRRAFSGKIKPLKPYL